MEINFLSSHSFSPTPVSSFLPHISLSPLDTKNINTKNMATLLYLMMRPLWRNQKLENGAHRRYPYKDDDDDYIDNNFSDFFFVEDKQHEAKSRHKANAENAEQGRDGDGDTKHDVEDDYEIIDGSSLQVSAQVDLGNKKNVPAEHAHQASPVPRPGEEEMGDRGCFTTVTAKTKPQDAKLPGKWVVISHRVSP